MSVTDDSLGEVSTGACIYLATGQLVSICPIIKQIISLLLYTKSKDGWLRIVKTENLETTSNKMHSAVFAIGLLLLIMLTERVVLSQSNTQGSIGFQSEHLADASTLSVNIIF